MSLAFDTTPGRKGATSARREDLDPINLVSMIMKKYPEAGVDEVCRRVRTALAGSYSNYQEAFDNYCTRNHFNLLQAPPRRRAARAAETSASTAATATPAAVKEEAEKRSVTIFEKMKNIVLMELPTPFGKPLGDLNEMEGCKLSGWQSMLFAGIGKRRLRDVKSEKSLHEAFAKATGRS